MPLLEKMPAQRLKDIKAKYKAMPVPEMPDNEGTELVRNPDDLEGIGMDVRIMSFGSWRSWVVYQLGELEGELSLVESLYDLTLAQETGKLEKSAAKRILKENLRGMAIESSERLAKLWEEVVELKAERHILRGRFEYFNSQFETLSRVITRRGQDRRL